jgi:hypothetical protein
MCAVVSFSPSDAQYTSARCTAVRKDVLSPQVSHLATLDQCSVSTSKSRASRSRVLILKQLHHARKYSLVFYLYQAVCCDTAKTSFDGASCTLSHTKGTSPNQIDLCVSPFYLISVCNAGLTIANIAIEDLVTTFLLFVAAKVK